MFKSWDEIDINDLETFDNEIKWRFNTFVDTWEEWDPRLGILNNFNEIKDFSKYTPIRTPVSFDSQRLGPILRVDFFDENEYHVDTYFSITSTAQVNLDNFVGFSIGPSLLFRHGKKYGT